MRFLKALPLTVAALMLLAVTESGFAQTTLGYRQTNLACRIQCDPPNKPDVLNDPWGIAFLPGQNFLIAERGAGRVDSYDATGLLGSGVSLPLPAGSGATASRPTGIVADPTLDFLSGTTRFPFFVATEEGTIVGVNVVNGQLQDARVLVDRSSTASFTGITLLRPACCSAVLAVANFREGEINLFGLSAVAYPGDFVDPSLPSGYAPYNIQAVGNQVFVTYAKKDTNGAVVAGAGLGVVSIFDLEGNFVRRFVSDGADLNAPWGVTATSANFGPFPNKILVGNTGDDGRILVYDATTAQFLGPLTDSETFLISNPGMRALAFRGDHTSDGIGDPDTLYYTAASVTGLQNDGLFAEVQVGRLTTTQLRVAQAVVGVETTLTAEVHPVAGGDTATGKVNFSDNFAPIGEATLSGGIATLPYTFTTVGIHSVIAEYEGTNTLLESFKLEEATVVGATTTTTLTAPASVAFGAAVTFTSRTLSATGLPIPTGNVTFKEGATVLGVAPVDAAGTATFTTSTLTSGSHAVVASYAGTQVEPSSSAPVTVLVGGDFDFRTNVPAVTIAAGQSTNVMLTVNPSSGFTGAVTFNCLAPAGITCAFNPPTVNVNGAGASTTLTVRAPASARVSHTPVFALASFFGLFGTVLMGVRDTRKKAAIVLLVVVAFGFSLVACGGSGSSGGAGGHNPQTFTVTLNATANSISHSTNLTVTVP